MDRRVRVTQQQKAQLECSYGFLDDVQLFNEKYLHLPCMQDIILAQKPELFLPLGGRSVQV